MIDNTNTVAKLQHKIANLTGSESHAELVALRAACDKYPEVDITGLEAAIQADVTALTNGSSIKELTTVAQAAADVKEESKGSPIPILKLKNVFNEPVSKGERGFVGRDIFTKEPRYIPRLNRGGIFQQSDNLNGWHYGGYQNYDSPSHCHVVETSDGNVLTVGYLTYNQQSDGSSSIDIYTHVFDPNNHYNKLSSNTLTEGNIRHDIAPYTTGTLYVVEAKTNFFVGMSFVPSSSGHARGYLFSFHYNPADNTCGTARFYSTITFTATYTQLQYGIPMLAVSQDTNSVYLLSPVTYVSSNRANSKIFVSTITGSAGNYVLGTPTHSGSEYSVSGDRYDFEPNVGLYSLSNGNVILLSKSLYSQVSNVPNYTGTRGEPITVLDPTNNAIITQHSFHPAGSNVAGTQYNNNRPVAIGQISANEFVLIISDQGNSNSDHFVLRVSYDDSTDAITVVHTDTIPSKYIKGMLFTDVSQAGVNKTRATRYDVANKRFILLGNRAVNVINFNNDYTVNFGASGHHPTRVGETQKSDGTESHDILAVMETIHCTLLSDNRTLVKLESLNRSSASAPNYDVSKMCFITTFDIMQAGAWGYPVTVKDNAIAGADIELYGLSDGYVSIEGGTPQSKLEDAIVVTDTVATQQTIYDCAGETTLPVYKYSYSSEQKATFHFGQYAPSENTLIVHSFKQLSNVQLDEASVHVEVDEPYQDIGLSFFYSSNADINYFALVEIDGFPAWRSEGNERIANTNTNAYFLHGLDIRNASTVKVYCGSDSNALDIGIYQKK